jgi:class 3 adenylate cyclase/tetratricopeptide (TPR) repeat protein
MEDRKLAAIVFTDIVGYTKRMEADEDQTMKLLARQRDVIFPVVKEFGGEIIKEIGDGLLMMFTSANRAVRFAMSVQEKLKDDELTIRAGIHIGDVIFEGGDVFGSAVNIAARIEPLAPAGGICISEDVRSQIRNQKDIVTASVGKKELKGVNEAIEIFRVVGSESEVLQKRIPAWKDLWQRRVIQVTLVYLVLAYLVRLAVGYMVKEYMLSPHLTNLVWYVLLSLIPSIIMLAYFHGKRGISKWTRVELIGMPVNVILALLVMIFIFKGKDLGAMTTTVTVQNEEGESIDKLVMKNEFRKKILIYNMDNISGDSSLDYLQYGIPEMVHYDLSRDLLITSLPAMKIYTTIQDAGYEDATGLPLTLMKRIAEQRFMNYFLFGTLDKQLDQYIIKIKLYETKLTRLITEFIVEANDPFSLSDQLSVQIKKGVGFPESHIAKTEDLPLKASFTDSKKALYYYSLSVKEEALNNWTEGLRLLDMAIREDPQFAFGYASITIAYFQNGEMEKAKNAVQSAIELGHKLTDRNQFIVKFVHYVFEQQPEKVMAVLKMWVDLYPEDLVAHATLANRYEIRGMYPEAIKEYKELLRLEPDQNQFLLTVARLFMGLGSPDSALSYYQKYAEKLPQESTSYRKLGEFYYLTGDMNQAKENYENALLIADPNEKARITIELANLLIRTGEFEQAFEKCMEAMDLSKTASDSAAVYQVLEKFYLNKGQVYKSLESHELKLEKYSSVLTPTDQLAFQAFQMRPYIHAGEFDKAFNILEEIAVKLEPPLDNIVPFGYMMLYAELGEVEKARNAMKGAEELAKGFGQEALLTAVYYARAKIDELEGAYSEAIENYNKILDLDATEYLLHSHISRCYRHQKEYRKAREEIELCLKHLPYNPVCNYEAALLYLETGDEDKGLEHLQRAVEIWKDADKDYDKANLAKEKLASLEAGP